MIVDLLEREHGCWVSCPIARREDLLAAVETERPALIVVDACDFPSCCRELLVAFPAERIVVIGPEPDAGYRSAAMRGGAGGWLPRDDLGDLSAVLRHALGCTHGPCPPQPVHAHHLDAGLEERHGTR